MFNDVEIILK